MTLTSSVANVFAVAAFQVEKRLAVVSSALVPPALPRGLLSSLGLFQAACSSPGRGCAPGLGALPQGDPLPREWGHWLSTLLPPTHPRVP